MKTLNYKLLPWSFKKKRIDFWVWVYYSGKKEITNMLMALQKKLLPYKIWDYRTLIVTTGHVKVTTPQFFYTVTMTLWLLKWLHHNYFTLWLYEWLHKNYGVLLNDYIFNDYIFNDYILLIGMLRLAFSVWKNA